MTYWYSQLWPTTPFEGNIALMPMSGSGHLRPVNN